MKRNIRWGRIGRILLVAGIIDITVRLMLITCQNDNSATSQKRNVPHFLTSKGHLNKERVIEMAREGNFPEANDHHSQQKRSMEWEDTVPGNDTREENSTKYFRTSKPDHYVRSDVVEDTKRQSGTSEKSKECVKKLNIAFLKTHKSGGSTVSNILHRFGLQYSLNFLLPKYKENIYSFWAIKDKNLEESGLIPLKPGQQYNLITTHTKYNKAAYDRVMPPGYATISIMREPEDHFVSVMFYFYPQLINKTNHPYIFSTFFSKRQSLPGQAEDFGVPPYGQTDVRNAQILVKRLDNEFDFVMLLEYFDESLVHLRRKFCWHLRDILYLVHNKNSSRESYALTQRNRQQLMQILACDYIFYEHFKKKFWHDVLKNGEDFFMEVQYFKTILRNVRDYCIHQILKSLDPLLIPASEWNEPFSVKPEDCQLMKMSEPIMVNKLMSSAWAKYQGSKATV